MQISLHVKEYDVGDAAASNTEDHPTGILSSLLVIWLRLLFNPTIHMFYAIFKIRNYLSKRALTKEKSIRNSYSYSFLRFLNPPSVTKMAPFYQSLCDSIITNHKYRIPFVNKEEKSNTNNPNNPIISLHLALFHRTKI